MNIKTKEFNVSEAEFRHINRIVYYRQMKTVIIIFAIITVIVVIQATFTPQAADIIFAIQSVSVLSLLLALPYIINSAKAQGNIHFQNRTCEINDNYLSITLEDGSSSKTHFNNYIKATREFDWYFVYLTNTKFEYLPIRAFNSEDDINEFEAALKNKKLLD